jgi:hypothetical protein
VDDELIKVFVTMKSKGETTNFDWLRHVEELRAAISEAVREKDWGWLQVYGPDNDAFSPPAICIEAQMTSGALGEMLEYLSQSDWIDLPVYIYVAKTAMH